jgi:hypothetical protein
MLRRIASAFFLKTKKEFLGILQQHSKDLEVISGGFLPLAGDYSIFQLLGGRYSGGIRCSGVETLSTSRFTW